MVNGNRDPNLKIITLPEKQGNWFTLAGKGQTYIVDIGSVQEIHHFFLYCANEQNRPVNVNISVAGSLGPIEESLKQCLTKKANIGSKITDYLMKNAPLISIEGAKNSAVYPLLIEPVLKGLEPTFPINKENEFSKLFQVRWFESNWKSFNGEYIAPFAYEYHKITPDMLKAIKPIKKNLNFTIKSKRIEYFSTGLFLYPGNKLAVKLTNGSSKGWKIRIGCHTDNLTSKDHWDRWPIISITENLENEMTVVSPYGGLVLVESAGYDACDSKTISVELNGAVDSPIITLNSNISVKDYNSPWVELEGKII